MSVILEKRNGWYVHGMKKMGRFSKKDPTVNDMCYFPFSHRNWCSKRNRFSYDNSILYKGYDLGNRVQKTTCFNPYATNKPEHGN